MTKSASESKGTPREQHPNTSSEEPDGQGRRRLADARAALRRAQEELAEIQHNHESLAEFLGFAPRRAVDVDKGERNDHGEAAT